MGYTRTYKVTNYPGSSFAQKISWACTCGKKGTITDGAKAPTMARARAAHKTHLAPKETN